MNRSGRAKQVPHRKVFELISHRTNKHPILSKEIESTLGISGPIVRDSVRALRRAGYPIVATESGYFVATSIEEVIILVNDLKRRIDSMGKTLSAIKSKAFERFGQQAVFEFMPPSGGVPKADERGEEQNNRCSRSKSESGSMFLLQTDNRAQVERQNNRGSSDNSLDELLLKRLGIKTTL